MELRYCMEVDLTLNNNRYSLIEKDSEEYIEILNTSANLTWCWNHLYFLHSKNGNNYIFSYMVYDYGTNDLYLYKGSDTDFMKELRIEYGKDKGYNIPAEYFGVGRRITPISKLVDKLLAKKGYIK